MPSFSTSLRSSTSTLRSNCLPSFFACWPAGSACSGWRAGCRTRAPASRRRRSPGPARRPCCTAFGSASRQSSVTELGVDARRRARLGVAVDVDRVGDRGDRAPRRARRRALPRRRGDAEVLRAAALERAEAGGDRGLERFRGIVGRRRRTRRARRDAGRPVQVERLALLQRQVAVARRPRRASAASGASSAAIGRSPITTSTSASTRDVGEAAGRRDLVSEVHNSRPVDKSGRCYSIQLCVENSRATSARRSSSS